MKIAFFVQYCHEAGTYYRWHNLAKALQLQGATVDIYAGDFNYKTKSRVEIRDGIKYNITPSLITCRIFGNPSDPFTACYRWLKTPIQQYDVVHLFQPFIQACLPWYKYKNKAKLVYDWDDLWTGGLFRNYANLREYYTYKLVSFLENKLPNLAVLTTTCSNFLQSRLSFHRTEIIFNGYWSLIGVHQNESDVIIKDSKYKYAGYIGRTAAEIDWLVYLAKRLSDEKLMYKLVIAGIHETLMRDSGLLDQEAVIYLGDLSSAQAYAVTKQLDIGLMPLEDTDFNKSRFPIKLFDYLLVGIPVYYSAVGMLDEIGRKMNNMINGGNTKEQWVDNFILLASNSSAIASNSSIYKIKEQLVEYSWESIGSKLLAIYYSI